MNITKTITLCLVLAATTAVVSGQAAYVLRTPAAAESEGFYLPSAQYPSGADSTVAHVPTFNLPHFFSGAVAPPAGSGQGGHTVNQNTNRMLSTDGFHLWEEPHPRYPDPGFVPSAPVPVGIFAGVTPRIMVSLRNLPY